MGKDEITKKVLIAVAEDLNKVMGLDPAIEVNRQITNAKIEKDLIEAAKELLKDDEITDKSKEVLITLGVELPGKVEEAEKESKVEPKAEPKSKKVDKKIESEKPIEKPIEKKADTKKKLKKYTRVQAFCDALDKEPKTIKEMAQKAKDLYDKANPGKEESKLSYIQWTIEKYYIVPFVILGFVELKDKKYSLK